METLFALKAGKPLQMAAEAISEIEATSVKLTPPREEIHTNRYYHEKACADVFVTLGRSGTLHDWEAHRKIHHKIIPDRIARIPELVYIEVEMGSKDEIYQKAENYRRYYRETREDFRLWFFVKTQKQYEAGLKSLEGFTQHYGIQLLSEFNSDTRSDTHSDSAEPVHDL